MGLEGLQEELDFLTGRYTMRRRPTHGRLFQTPSSNRHSPLESMAVEGTRMRLPDTPRSYPSFGSTDSRTPASGSASSMLTADIGEGLHRRARHDEAYNRRLQRKSYSTPLYDPDAARRSRTVRFGAPRSASNTPQPMVLPEQIEVPQPVWEDEMPLEGELFDFEPAHAREQQQEQVVVVWVKEPTAESSFEPVIVTDQPDAWLEELAKKKQKTPTSAPPEPEVVEEPPAKNVKPKPQPKKAERPPAEKVLKAPRPKPEKPPPSAAQPKPVKQPKSAKPPKQPRPAKPKPEPKEKKIIQPKPAPKPPPPTRTPRTPGTLVTEEKEPVTLDLPTLPPALPDLNKPLSARSGTGRGNRATMTAPLMAMKTKPRWGQKQRDTTLSDEEERERLAEERRKRHQEMMERHKVAKAGNREHSNHDGPNFDDYGFLAKYCIMTPSASDKYRYTFDHMDEGEKRYLTEEETAYGLRAINPSLSTSERNYLFRVLEIAGHKMSKGTDFRLFSILAALSQRVSKLDEWARNMMAELDYKHLERKLFLCRTLWECNVDENTNTISLDQLIVELRAGGVSPQHEREVRKKLANLRSLDFFDFLMYVPLFIIIHESVVTDPLSDSRSF